MKRRQAIKQLFFFAGGLVIASSCIRKKEESSIALNNFSITGEQEDLLADLCEAIIPKTDTPGSKELGIHLFVLKMLDDCHSPEEQSEFIKELKGLKIQKGEDSDRYLAYLEKLDEDDLLRRILKRRTIQGYMNSEYVMKNLIVYEMVPGRYHGAVKI